MDHHMHSSSDTDLFELHETRHPLSTKHRASVDGERKRDDEMSQFKSLLFVINIQKTLIETYKNKLDEATSELNHCKQGFQQIKASNNFDPDQVTEALIHDAKNDDDKIIFQNAIRFMQNKLNYILNALDS